MVLTCQNQHERTMNGRGKDCDRQNKKTDQSLGPDRLVSQNVKTYQ
jgi:hypothetical protein